jgi:hypothetical protein
MRTSSSAARPWANGSAADGSTANGSAADGSTAADAADAAAARVLPTLEVDRSCLIWSIGTPLASDLAFARLL